MNRTNDIMFCGICGSPLNDDFPSHTTNNDLLICDTCYETESFCPRCETILCDEEKQDGLCHECGRQLSVEDIYS